MTTSAVLENVGDARRERPAESVDRGVRGSEIIVLALLVLGILAFGLLVNSQDPLLGTDESIYAERVRDISDGTTPGDFWEDLRAPGLSAFLWAVPYLGDSADGMRFGVMITAALGVVVTWAFARELAGRRVALVAAALLGLAPGYVRWSSYVWPDTPGAVLSLAAVTVFAYASRGGKVRAFAFWAIPIAVLATYTRFGSPIPIAVGCTVLALSRWRAVRASIGLVAGLAVGMAASMAPILLVPQFTGATESPITSIYDVPDKGLPWYQSFTDFARDLPDYLGASSPSKPTLLLGWLFFLFVSAGIAVGVARAIRLRETREAVIVPLAIAALLLLVLAAGIDHGEGRYLTPAVPYVLVGAAPGIVYLGTRVSRQVAVVAIAAGVILGVANLVAVVDHDTDGRTDPLGHGVASQAGETLDATLDADCVVVTNFAGPQISYYSGCTTFEFPQASSDDRALEELDQLISDHPESAIAILVERPEGEPIPTASRLREYLGQDGEDLGLTDTTGDGAMEVYLLGAGQTRGEL